MSTEALIRGAKANARVNVEEVARSILCLIAQSLHECWSGEPLSVERFCVERFCDELPRAEKAILIIS